MNYEDMSDFEISFAVAKILGLKVCDGYHFEPKVSYWNKEGSCTMFDAMSWADMGPIIQEYGIDIEHPEEELGNIGQASKYINVGTDIFFEYNDKKDTLRAAAIVFLMSQEGK